MPHPDAPPPPRRSLRKEITGVLVFKLVLILLAGFTIFGAQHRLHVDKEGMTNHLLGSTLSPTIPSSR